MINKAEYYQQRLEITEFLKISTFIEQNYGIRLPNTKLIMVQTRLIKRLIATEISSFTDYVKYVFAPAGKDEMQHMVNEITTNKTEFFREVVHFKFLSDAVACRPGRIKILSAGCSSGEEPYSIAIRLKEMHTDFEIYAGDLSNKALEKAKAGIYPENNVKPIPEELLKIYFTKTDTKYQINDYIKRTITFSYMNLMNEKYDLPKDFDFIFLRNVIIYFNEETQLKVLRKLAGHLKPNGYMILGLSENILRNNLKFDNLGQSIFQKTT